VTLGLSVSDARR